MPPAEGTSTWAARFGTRTRHARGMFAALDVTHEQARVAPAVARDCYSGSVVTAGGLVFVGRNDGRLTALDKANGKLLWEFQTDAGVNTTVTTFERNGEQHVVVHAGGGVFAGREARRRRLDVLARRPARKSTPRAARRERSDLGCAGRAAYGRGGLKRVRPAAGDNLRAAAPNLPARGSRIL